MEATVTSENTASRRLFSSFASAQGCRLDECPGYDARHLPPGQPPEHLLRIGPLAASQWDRGWWW